MENDKAQEKRNWKNIILGASLLTVIAVLTVIVIFIRMNINTISKEDAKGIAFKHAQAIESFVTFLPVETDYERGRKIYEVEFYAGGVKYEYKIDAKTKEIISYDIEGEKNAGIPVIKEMTREQAKKIALEHAQLNENQVNFLKFELDYDDNRPIYEIEFYYNNIKYEYEVDAYTGEITRFEKDFD
jgi:Predicted membrane protein